jgi:hypothetical protein
MGNPKKCGSFWFDSTLVEAGQAIQIQNQGSYFIGIGTNHRPYIIRRP